MRLPSTLRAALLVAVLAPFGCGQEQTARPALSPLPVSGTAARFNLDADLLVPETFYDIPYPSDLRLDAEGRAAHAGFPSKVGNRVIRSVIEMAGERRLWPTTPFAYFRFDTPLAERRVDNWLVAEPDSPVLLLRIDRGADDYARLLPTVASNLPEDVYAPEHLLAVGAPPGVILSSSATYAFVLLRTLGDAAGKPLGLPESFARLRAGLVPDGRLGGKAVEAYASLWPALRAAGVEISDVAAATVFSTGDVVAEVAALGASLRSRHSLTLEGLEVDPDDGEDHPRFCELRGNVRVPLFQRGEPPFNTDGRFEFGPDGLPVVQDEATVPFTLTLPRTSMPTTGFPMLLYFHGTDGTADQVVDRGPVRELGGPRAAGEGPAHVLAAHGVATFGAALPLNPERYRGPAGLSQRSYLNLNNLAAYPDTFQQMAIEQLMFIDALESLRIAPEVVAACQLPTPAGDRFRFDTRRLFAMGQSLGGQIVNMVGAIEPRVVGVVPTGSGGYWSLTIVSAEFGPGVDAAPLVALLLGVEAIPDHLHPALQLVQSGFEIAEPLVYAVRLARDPLPGHPARSIYQPVAIDDPGFPNSIYAAMALASGNEQAGDRLHPLLPQALALDDRAGLRSFPVTENRLSGVGEPYTGVVVQYQSDGLLDGHHIFAQLDEVKFQYGCFFQSMLAGGPGRVLAPAPLGNPCDN